MKHKSIESPEHSTLPQTGAHLYESLRAMLERDHFGAYVMINTANTEYVVGRTTSEAHTKFIERFGETTPGWCTRIGASVFAST